MSIYWMKTADVYPDGGDDDAFLKFRRQKANANSHNPQYGTRFEAFGKCSCWLMEHRADYAAKPVLTRACALVRLLHSSGQAHLRIRDQSAGQGGLMGNEFWSWIWETYKANREHIVPLLTFVAASIVAWAALRQARTATRQAKTAAQQAEIARLRHEEQTKADHQQRITESFTKAVEQLGSEKPQSASAVSTPSSASRGRASGITGQSWRP